MPPGASITVVASVSFSTYEYRCTGSLNQAGTDEGPSREVRPLAPRLSSLGANLLPDERLQRRQWDAEGARGLLHLECRVIGFHARHHLRHRIGQAGNGSPDRQVLVSCGRVL